MPLLRSKNHWGKVSEDPFLEGQEPREQLDRGQITDPERESNAPQRVQSQRPS